MFVLKTIILIVLVTRAVDSQDGDKVEVQNIPLAGKNNVAAPVVRAKSPTLLRQGKPNAIPVDNNAIPDPHIMRQNPPKRVPQKMKEPLKGLMASEECREDSMRICQFDPIKRNYKSNLELLSCMTNSNENAAGLSPECHHYLWQYKLNITMDEKFDSVARDLCKDAMTKFTDCQEFGPKSGKLIPCLIDHKQDIKARPCYHFLEKMSMIIFSDYRLICDFVDNCGDEINSHKCGKVVSSTMEDDPDAYHSQGSVIACLQSAKVHKSLSGKCVKQIQRLAELSSDDFHLDRNLYFKCKSDREHLCQSVSAGEGKVYKCLFRHKFDSLMSADCRSALTLRQQLVSQDYKVSYELHANCRKEIDAHRCTENPRYMGQGVNDHNDLIGLSGMLLCLEDQKLDGRPIDEKCDNTLNDFRRMLSEDYEINPEIVSGCSREIAEDCEGGIQKRGETIHCLMGLAQRNKQLSDTCEAAIMHLLKENHAASDYRMDHALHEACFPVVKTACKSIDEGDPMILSCLMENLYENSMTDECQKRLLELQYFISRDFFLDQTFVKKCNRDAKRLCEVKLSKAGDDSMPFSLVISCLYRHIPGHSNIELAEGKETSEGCSEEVFRIMSSRALNFNLNPDLEHACLSELGRLCSDEMVEKGKELICLQDKFEEIKDQDCIDKLEEVTELEEEEVDKLDDILMRACKPEIKRFCQDALNDDDDTTVMRCLMQNKVDLNEACAAGVTHFQLIELKDIKFSYSFMKACKNDIDSSCQNLRDGVHTKTDVVLCLSQKSRDAVLTKSQNPISPECREQLTAENLQRHENVQLDPDLYNTCLPDYKLHCSKVAPGKAQGIECLRNHKNKLSAACRQKLFGFEKEEAQDRNLDFLLLRTCKASVKKWCQQQLKQADPSSVLDCLIHNKEFLDKGCRKIVVEREREMYSDINLHPDLKDACMPDIMEKCNDALIVQEQDEENGEELMGRVISCLKSKEVSTKRKDALKPECSRHIKFVMQEEQTDYRLDPMLTIKCVEAITKLCEPGRGGVVECLKQRYFEGQLQKYQECMIEVARLLKEGRSDIMADPILHNACITDIGLHCRGIVEGQGRIMGCLISVAGDNGKQMTENCRGTIIQRKEMWRYAESQGAGSFSDIGNMILTSPHQSYFVTVLTLFILTVLILGMCCGRITKRVSRQRKML